MAWTSQPREWTVVGTERYPDGSSLAESLGCLGVAVYAALVTIYVIVVVAFVAGGAALVWKKVFE